MNDLPASAVREHKDWLRMRWPVWCCAVTDGAKQIGRMQQMKRPGRLCGKRQMRPHKDLTVSSVKPQSPGRSGWATASWHTPRWSLLLLWQQHLSRFGITVSLFPTGLRVPEGKKHVLPASAPPAASTCLAWRRHNKCQWVHFSLFIQFQYQEDGVTGMNIRKMLCNASRSTYVF